MEKLNEICGDYNAEVTAVHSPGADVAGVRSVWHRVAGVRPVPVQMWRGEASPSAGVVGWAWSRCRCGRLGPVPVQMWLGCTLRKASDVHHLEPTCWRFCCVGDSEWQLNNCSRFENFRNFRNV
jgi:hypothetical protein